MKIISIIPARMESSRFPGKPMFKIKGIPMIEMVYKKVKKNKFLDEVIVATCNEEIFNHINSIGGVSIMTSKKHDRASDRSYEALIKYEKKMNRNYDIVVMVQGDEPMVHHKMITESVRPLIKSKKIQIVNLMSKIRSKQEFTDKNTIKVVLDKFDNALYFSRSPIPFGKFDTKTKYMKQVCIIPFRRNFLVKYKKLKPTKLEIKESVDMMRILENGYNVKMIETKFKTQAVDTREDAKRVEKLLS